MPVACQTMEQEEQQQNRGSDNIILLDILLEILSRLPLKSLLRFMCVCMHWKSLISSHSFRKLHRQRHNSRPVILTLRRSNDYEPHGTLQDHFLTTFDLYGKVVQQWTLPISFSFLNMVNFPSQSKLVCFTNAKRFFSYNPSTRQLFHLPNPPHFSLSGFKRHAIGFGFIPSKDEYIFVLLVDENPLNTEINWVCEVLTMSISNDNYQLHYNAWRSIEVTTKLRFVSFYSCVFVCGAFYWDAGDVNGNERILSFDVETEVFSTFGWPGGVVASWDTRLLELKDELYLMNVIQDPPTLDLWKLSFDVNNNKLWTLKWNINLQSLGYTEAPPPHVFDCSILIHRLEYLQYYNKPFNILQELGILKLEEDESNMLGEDEEFNMPGWCVGIHTNLFTL